MNKLFFALMFLTFSSFSQTRYEVTERENLIHWSGADIIGNGHEGTLALQSGYVLFSKDNVPIKGEFTIDMNTITSIDRKTGNGIEDLDKHLKSDDFFSVATFPKAFFTITQSSILAPTLNQFTIKGFLSIKGIINQISFPAILDLKEQTVRINANIIIDRTRWNITYQSKNFLSNIKDTAISDNLKITLNLVLSKK